jgi:hypothetical protein
MNTNRETLQAEYSKRFMLAVGSIAVGTATASLILLGSRITNDHLMGSAFLAVVSALIAWPTTTNLCARYQQLKQLDALQKRGPYGTTEYVSPTDATRQVGNSDNMWG